MNGGRLIAVNKSRYFQKNSELALGTGAFVAGLEFSSGKVAAIVGKPSKEFFRLGITQYIYCKYYSQIIIAIQASSRFPEGIPRDQILMVGDDVRDDVIGILDNIKFLRLQNSCRRPGGRPAWRSREDGEIQIRRRGHQRREAQLCVQRPA